MTDKTNDKNSISSSVKDADDNTKASPSVVKKEKDSRQRREKENKIPPLDWRQSDNSSHTLPPPKSKGISPRKPRSRSRPGDSFVQAVHAKSRDIVLRDRKDQWIKDQHIKRSAYKEVTSLKTWPLQELALQDYNDLVKVYLNDDEKDKHGVVKSRDGLLRVPDHQYGDSSSSCNSTDKKRIMKDKASSPGKSQQKHSYREGFLDERRIPAHNVVPTKLSDEDDETTANKLDPAQKFDTSGLWSMEPRVFSVEKANGKRKYLVGHLGRVMDFMWRKTDRCSRYFYEMILEKTPCRLYFDLEFSIPDNPNIDVEQLMNELYDELLQELKTSFPGRHTEGLDRSHIVDLDSSTPQKFSRHWIVHLPSQALFVDTSQAGKFVKRFVQRLADEVATEQLKERRPQLQDYLFVNPKGTLAKHHINDDSKATTINIPLSQKTCFVDLGVYTRNRLFRLLGCSKFGKSPDCALRIAEMNQFPFPKGFGNEHFYVPAMDMAKSQSTTQHSNSDSSDNKDNSNDDEEEHNTLEKFKAMTDWSPHAEALCKTLVVPMNGRKIDYPILPEIVDATDSKSIPDHFSASTTTMDGKALRKTYTFTCSGPSFGTSPYPFIDDFISNELANRGGVRGSIRSWTLDYGPEDSENGNTIKRVPAGIAYQMSRNRWCECIGRSHKSNNILWRVSFQTKQCVQSCFDPDCRRMNFRGTPVDLSIDAVQQLEDALFEETIGQMDDADLLAQNKSAAKKASVNDNDNLGFDSADDAELEKAMMELNVGSPLAKKRPEIPNSSSWTAKESSAKTKDTGVAALSDDALLDAIIQNPELFG